MVYYTDENGNRHNELPKIWNGVTPFPEWYAIEHGWMRYEVESTSPATTDTSARDEAERAIVECIATLADKYGAIAELAQMESISIPSLISFAESKNVTDADLQAAETKILILARHLEAITRKSWADTWDGLKSRFATYLAYYLPIESSDSSEISESSETQGE